MNDKELLELAAKAAGMWTTGFSLNDDDTPDFNMEKGFRLAWGKGWWNPLTDDGDALQLAVQLDIVIWEFSQYDRAMVEVRYGDARGEYWGKGGDRFEDTRHVIVQAAAEIGKTK